MSPVQLEKSRILVVDDDAGVRETFVALLDEPHWLTDSADSAKQALEKMKKNPPDVVLLDIMMPDMDGLALCNIIKNDPATAHIPVILVTALSDKKSVARGLDSGADDFLCKPVSGIELQARVRSMLRIKRNHDRLEDSRRLRKELSDLIVHDLRTPVSVVAGCVELLEAHLGSDPQAHVLVERIRNQTHRMENFLTDLLLTAKLEAGRLKPQPHETNISQLVQRAADGFAPLVKNRAISFTVELPPHDFSWCLDESLVLRLLDNLFMNALKYTPAGGQIVVRVHPLDTIKGKQLSLEVADTGPGIPLELRDKIFEAYSIVEARKSGSVAIGLGLAFCNLVVSSHGGSITVSNNTPCGSLFSILIPEQHC